MALRRTLAVLTCALLANAQRQLNSTFFGTCMNNSQLTPSEFSVSVFDNGTISILLNGTSTYTGNDTLEFDILESSKWVYTSPFDPCNDDNDLGVSLCPASAGDLNISTNFQVPRNQLPAYLFTSSTLFAEFRFYINNTATSEPVGCVKTTLVNGVKQSYNASDPEGMNATATSEPAPSPSNTSNSSGGGTGGSNASTGYLNWTLLMYVESSSNHIVSKLTSSSDPLC